NRTPHRPAPPGGGSPGRRCPRTPCAGGGPRSWGVSRGQAKQVTGAVAVGSGEGAAVRRKGQAPDRAAELPADELFPGGVPDHDLAVLVGGGQPFVVRQGDGTDPGPFAPVLSRPGRP